MVRPTAATTSDEESFALVGRYACHVHLKGHLVVMRRAWRDLHQAPPRTPVIRLRCPRKNGEHGDHEDDELSHLPTVRRKSLQTDKPNRQGPPKHVANAAS